MSAFEMSINGVPLSNGVILPFEKSQQNPVLKFKRSPNDNYTIIAVDPDAPSKTNPINKHWLHLLIINNNNRIVKYQKPAPPVGSGNHRYIFYLLKQKDILDGDHLELARDNNNKVIRQKFDLDKFIADNNLSVVDFIYFETSR